MAKYVADSIYLASIFPGKLERMKLNHGVNPKHGSPRSTVYFMPPVPRDGVLHIPDDAKHNVKSAKAHSRHFAVMEVMDAFENILDPVRTAENAQNGGGARIWGSGPVPCDEIAQTLMQHWTGNLVAVPPGASPGVMRIINSVPTQEEAEQLLRMQNAFYEWMFQQGEILARANDWKHITDNMRDACDWLGQKRNWSHPGETGSTINCPECRSAIPWDTRVCVHCKTRLQPMAPEIAQLNQPAA